MPAASPPSIVHRVRSVLLVSCPEALQQHLKARIGPAGWLCVAASGVQEARRVLHEVRPALVLIGSEDPVEREQVLQSLRADPLVAGVPVLATANGRLVPDADWIGAHLDDALRAGAAREAYAALDRLLSPQDGWSRVTENLPTQQP